MNEEIKQLKSQGMTGWKHGRFMDKTKHNKRQMQF